MITGKKNIVTQILMHLALVCSVFLFTGYNSAVSARVWITEQIELLKTERANDIYQLSPSKKTFKCLAPSKNIFRYGRLHFTLHEILSRVEFNAYSNKYNNYKTLIYNAKISPKVLNIYSENFLQS